MQTKSTGYKTLEIISESDNFNYWIIKKIKKFIKGEVLELGSGIGNISKFLVEKFDKVTLSDYDSEYTNLLKKEFKNSVLKIDIGDINSVNEIFTKFDTIILLNVLEHIENDEQVILNCKKILNYNGIIILQVPAFKSLYNSFDSELGHFKRYSKNDLIKLANTTNLIVEKIYYFNSVGIFGWFINGNILKRKIIPKKQMKLFDNLIPFIKLCDFFLNRFLGLSIICVLKSTDKTA